MAIFNSFVYVYQAGYTQNMLFTFMVNPMSWDGIPIKISPGELGGLGGRRPRLRPEADELWGYIYIYVYIYTIWLFNIAMENHHF